MAETSSIVGIALMVIGGVFVAIGAILCYVTKGEYYNQDEVQAMVAAEVLEEEKKKRAEAEAAEQAIREEMEHQELGQSQGLGDMHDNEMGFGRKKRRGPMIAS